MSDSVGGNQTPDDEKDSVEKFFERLEDPGEPDDDEIVVEVSDDEEKALRIYLEDVQAWNSIHTLRNRKVATRQWLEYLQEERFNSLFDATSSDVRHFATNLLNDDYAPRSVRNKIYDVSAMYGFFVSEDNIPVSENPTDDEDVEKKLSQLSQTKLEEEDAREYLEIEDYEKMRDACESLRNQVVLELLWNTGVRASEAVSIEIRDIDRDERTIEVDNAKGREHGDAGSREVFYSRSFARTLRKWLDEGGRDAYMYADESDKLLLTKANEEMFVNRVSEIIRNLAEEAGIQSEVYIDQAGRPRNEIHAHILRKSYAVHRVKRESGKGGMPLPYLQELMGHSSVEVTRDRYLKFRGDDIQKAERAYSPNI